MPRPAVLVVCAVLFACDADRPTKPLESPAKAKPEPIARTEPPAKVDAPARADPPQPEPKDALAELTAKPHPTLVGPFAALTFSPSLAIRDARKQAPKLFAATRPGSLTGPFTFSSDEWPGQAFDVVRMGQIDSEPDTWLVESLRIVMLADGVEAALVAAWGEPQTDGNAKIWLAPALGLRAELHRPQDLDSERIAITLRGYTPLATFIGTDPKFFGFEEGAPILGAKGSDLIRRFGRRIFDYDKVRLWPIERGGPIDLQFADPLALGEEDLPDHVVTGFSLEIGNDAAVSALLEKKLGKPKPDPEDERVRVYRKSPRITFDGTELVVGVAPSY